MRRAIAAVIGHVDHGKTALVRALTGTDTDRLEEEKRRGISIALGFAHLHGEGIDLVDVPGHERFVRVAVAGAGGIDVALLAVAATERVMPQTREHLAIAALLGIERCVLAVTKCDLVPDPSAQEAAAVAARDAVARAGLRCEATAFTAPHGAGIDALRAALLRCRDALPPRPDDGLPFLPVDRAFSVAGHGTVLTGTLRGGVLRVGDAVSLLPGGGGLEARIRGLQTHGQPVTQAGPGVRVAVNLRGVARDRVAAGAVLAPPGRLAESGWLGVWLRAAGADLRTGSALRLLVGTDELDVRLRLLDRELLADGEAGPAQLRLSRPLAVPAGLRFVLRVASPPATVGGGTVIEPDAVRARRNDAAVCERFRLRATGLREAVLADAVRRAGRRGIGVAALARLGGCGEAQAVAALGGRMVATRGGLVVAPEFLAQVEAGIGVILRRAAAAGLDRAALARLLPGVGEAVLAEALGRLERGGAITRTEGVYRPADPGGDRARQDAQAAALSALAGALRAGGLSPPDLPGGQAGKRLLDALVRRGIAVRTLDRVQKREIVFHAEAIEAARRTLAPLLRSAPAGIGVGAAGEALGISRKYSVPLLEHLDRIGFTIRDGDRRRLAG